MLGKEKCRILKEIRQRIADENDIPWVTQECTHKGSCRGTCPKCESELRELERQLAEILEDVSERILHLDDVVASVPLVEVLVLPVEQE